MKFECAYGKLTQDIAMLPLQGIQYRPATTERRALCKNCLAREPTSESYCHLTFTYHNRNFPRFLSGMFKSGQESSEIRERRTKIRLGMEVNNDEFLIMPKLCFYERRYYCTWRDVFYFSIYLRSGRTHAAFPISASFCLLHVLHERTALIQPTCLAGFV